jgi:hypothetical protein
MSIIDDLILSKADIEMFISSTRIETMHKFKDVNKLINPSSY